MAGVVIEPFFLAAAPGQRFCLLSAPAGDVRGAVLCVHPFAEEMNKARRTAALAARALARNGFAVLEIDLHGCGDSSGEFGDATWRGWIDDVVAGYRYLARRYRFAPSLWGIRLGCLLATEALGQLDGQPDLLLWQPVISGRVHLNQFLRLKAVGDTLANADDRANTTALRARIAAGETIEVAGYGLSPALAEPMERAELDLPAGHGGRVLWCEVVSPGSEGIAPATEARVSAWTVRGIGVAVVAVRGLPFWQTQEIDECPALVDATVDAWQPLPA